MAKTSLRSGPIVRSPNNLTIPAKSITVAEFKKILGKYDGLIKKLAKPSTSNLDRGDPAEVER